MKKIIAQGVVGLVALSVLVVGLIVVVTPTVAAPSCERQCYQDYHKCVPFCAKNPCFIACEDVLQICLSNCGSPS